jgi:YjbR
MTVILSSRGPVGWETGRIDEPRWGVGGPWQGCSMAQRERPEVPPALLRRLRRLVAGLPECHEEAAWVGVRWQVGTATVAHVFGGEDQLFRIVFRADPEEVMAFQHLGHPYFRTGWGRNVVGLVLGEQTDWQELAELLTDSYCVQAPAYLVERVPRPG